MNKMIDYQWNRGWISVINNSTLIKYTFSFDRLFLGVDSVCLFVYFFGVGQSMSFLNWSEILAKIFYKKVSLGWKNNWI